MPPPHQLTNTRFSSKCSRSPAQMLCLPEMLCVAEEAGRLWVAGCSEQERGWVSRIERESWLGLHWG